MKTYMTCSIISPTEKNDFRDISSIHAVTTSGERELLPGHIALAAELAEGQSLTLTTSEQKVRVTLARGSFIQFARNSAEVLSPLYSIEDAPRDS